MRILRHQSVVAEDLPDIYARIARDNPAAAERVLDAIGATFTQLAEHPESGVCYPARILGLYQVRMVPVREFSNFLIFYRIEEGAVFILYVVHGSRHMPRLFRRDPRE